MDAPDLRETVATLAEQFDLLARMAAAPRLMANDAPIEKWQAIKNEAEAGANFARAALAQSA